MEVTKLILEIVNTTAIVAGAAIAIIGVNAWKKQLKGKTDYELARRYLKAVYKVRYAIKYVRNPFISSDEIFVALKESGLSDSDYDDRKKSNRAVYGKRWEKVTSSLSDLEVELLEAEVSWGPSALEVTTDFNNLRKKIFVSLKMFLEQRPLNEEREDVIYDAGEDDAFNIEMKKAIEKIENFLKPHLK